MTLKGNTIFKEKLTGGLKNGRRNLVNFHVGSWKSENLCFDGLHLSIAYKVSAKNVQKSYLSRRWRVIQTFKTKLTFCLKNNTRNLVNFNASSGKSENLHFDKLLLSKVCNIWAKKIQRSCVVKMTYNFKNDITKLVSFHTSSWK